MTIGQSRLELGSGSGGGGGGDGEKDEDDGEGDDGDGRDAEGGGSHKETATMRAANCYYVPHTTVSSLPRQRSLIRTTLEAKNGKLKQEKLSNLTVGGRVETHAIRLQNLLS